MFGLACDVLVGPRPVKFRAATGRMRLKLHRLISSFSTSIMTAIPTRFPPPAHLHRLPFLRPNDDSSQPEPSPTIRLTDQLRDQFRLRVPLLALRVQAGQISDIKSNPITRSLVSFLHYPFASFRYMFSSLAGVIAKRPHRQ